ncbi:unnamed protein product [Protopolystoma xenopodis]|uniref:Uncharacterized protein n=1 Tax=Protopolystoma xenopodis TaxID=117903 RepID=A0A3S5BFM6_9PLAT|nr:unnamed protein product [Protopolystoma xenopodis]
MSIRTSSFVSDSTISTGTHLGGSTNRSNRNVGGGRHHKQFHSERRANQHQQHVSPVDILVPDVAMYACGTRLVKDFDSEILWTCEVRNKNFAQFKQSQHCLSSCKMYI